MHTAGILPLNQERHDPDWSNTRVDGFAGIAARKKLRGNCGIHMPFEDPERVVEGIPPAGHSPLPEGTFLRRPAERPLPQRRRPGQIESGKGITSSRKDINENISGSARIEKAPSGGPTSPRARARGALHLPQYGRLHPASPRPRLDPRWQPDRMRIEPECGKGHGGGFERHLRSFAVSSGFAPGSVP